MQIIVYVLYCAQNSIIFIAKILWWGWLKILVIPFHISFWWVDSHRCPLISNSVKIYSHVKSDAEMVEKLLFTSQIFLIIHSWMSLWTHTYIYPRGTLPIPWGFLHRSGGSGTFVGGNVMPRFIFTRCLGWNEKVEKTFSVLGGCNRKKRVSTSISFPLLDN